MQIVSVLRRKYKVFIFKKQKNERKNEK